MGPEAIHDLTPAYALDALDAQEAAEFEQHLRHCEHCRAELADLQETTSLLAYATPPTPAPVGLRGGILEQARTERQNVIPFPRRRRSTWALGAAAAAAAAAAIGLGIWAAVLHNDLGAERSAHNRAADALAIVAAPGTSHVDLAGANGTLAVGQSGRAVLVIPDLKKAPAGKTYEAWVIHDAKPSRAGLFGGGGSTVVPLTRLVQPGSVVAVTVEREGGVDMPTQTRFISAQA